MKETELLTRLADVDLPPPAPGPATLMLVISALCLSIIVAGVALWYLRKRRSARLRTTTPQAALKRLDALHAAWLRGDITQRDAAYQLAALLRLGLGTPQLSAPALRHEHAPQHWHETLSLLDQLRYPHHTEQALTPQVFAQIRVWLQQTDHRVSG